MKIECPSYIDVGAYKYDSCSNTYLFYLNGSRGVCIEPDPRLYSAFKANRQGDVCLNAAISYGREEEVELFLFTEPSMNTLLEDEARRRDQVGESKLVGSVRVPTIRLELVIETYFRRLPDFVSIDIEGLDYEILANFDFGRYPVPVWMVETVEYSPSHIKPKLAQMQTLMESKGYFIYADTYINTCFVKNDWFFKRVFPN
jgi:FkbM family methyltransferase